MGRRSSRHRTTRVGALVALLAAGLASGCAGMLPRADNEARSPFDSYDAAAAAFERIVGHTTTVAEMRALGFDPAASANVTVIPYPQLTARLSPDPGVPFEALDPGIRECLLARQACRTYEFRFGHEASRREGNFVLDFLNFRRIARVTSWHFEGLVAVRDEVVLFRSYGGEPRGDRVERQVNPLGPLQPAGEAAGQLLRR
jgi:hypothetical protein